MSDSLITVARTILAALPRRPDGLLITSDADVPSVAALVALKRWEVKATEGDSAPDLVFLYSVIGRRNDEGTMAEVFARNKRMIVIGRRGGCQLLNPARYVTKQGKTVKVESKVQPRGIPACSSRVTT